MFIKRCWKKKQIVFSLREYGIWLLCLPINTIPVFCFHVLNIKERINLVTWLYQLVSDIDFAFIFICALGTLCIQLMCSENAASKAFGKVVKRMCIGLCLVFAFLYIPCKLIEPFDRIVRSNPFFADIVISLVVILVSLVVHLVCSCQPSTRPQP